MNWWGLAKREICPSSVTNVAAAAERQSLECLQRLHDWCKRPVRKRGLDVSFQTVLTSRRPLDGCNTIFQ